MSRNKLGNELGMSWASRAVGRTWSSARVPRVKTHGNGSRRSRSLAPAPHPFILLRFYSGSTMREGAVSFLDSLQFQSLSSLQDHLAKGLVLRHSLGTGTGLVAG